MTIEKLMELKHSTEAPYNHDDYTVWLHNKIMEDISYELWNFRENNADKIKSSYACCSCIMSLPSLQTIK